MSITYTYEIVTVNEAARVMEVVYTAEGHPTQHIGARLPYEGESLEAVIEMYSPVRFWEDLNASVIVPLVGTTGNVSNTPINEVIEDSEETIRHRRNLLLATSDWTQLSDTPLTQQEKEAWAAYRQLLRDIPQQTDFPTNVVFPSCP